jgi:hypothetical protein
MTPHRTILWLTVYAIAMANVEAVIVVHLRILYYPVDPTVIFPLVLLSQRDLLIEIVRELATLVMILGVAALAARKLMGIFAAFVYVFGVWDIFYYIWLKLMIGWPIAWLEWDLLFLIPWPWLGPWMTAALVALQFTLWGGWVLARAADTALCWRPLLLFSGGALLVLVSFLAPALPLLTGGEDMLHTLQPAGFLWAAYIPGYLLMIVGLWHIANPRMNPSAITD